eukprot:3952914-Amphidinium_carterae.1
MTQGMMHYFESHLTRTSIESSSGLLNNKLNRSMRDQYHTFKAWTFALVRHSGRNSQRWQ